MNDQELQDLCREWQQRLRLEDWDVSARFARMTDKVEGFADISASSSNRVARILLRNSDDIPSNWLGVTDLEVTLVHELLHLPASGFDSGFKQKEDSPEHIALELFIERCAQALVAAKRGRMRF